MAQNKNKGIFNFKNTKLKWLGYGLLCTSTLYTLSAQASLVNIMGDSNGDATFSTGAGTDAGGTVASGSALQFKECTGDKSAALLKGSFLWTDSSTTKPTEQWSINGTALRMRSLTPILAVSLTDSDTNMDTFSNYPIFSPLLTTSTLSAASNYTLSLSPISTSSDAQRYNLYLENTAQIINPLSTQQIKRIVNTVYIDTPLNIQAMNLNGYPPMVLSVNADTQLGSIVDNIDATNKMTVAIAPYKTLTLTGTGASTETDGFNANANDYTTVGSIIFDTAGALKINATNNNSITLNSTFTRFGSNTTLQVDTDAIITHLSVSVIDTINIGFKPPAGGATGTRPATLTVKPDNNVSLKSITFDHLNSALELDSSKGVNDLVYFYISAKSVGGKIDTVETDLSGIVKLNAKTKRLSLAGGGGGATLGIGAAKRLKELQILGDSQVMIYQPVFAGSLHFDTTAPVRFWNTADLGSNGSVTLEKDAQLKLSSLSAVSPTIDLGQQELLLKAGTMQLTGTPTINTSFDGTTDKMGHIKVDGTEKGTTLDLSGADSINIVLEADSELPAAGTQYKFPVFVSANGGIINIDHSKINFTSNEQNTYLTWSYENSELLTSLDDDDENPPSGGGTITGKIDASDLESNISSNDASLSAIDIAKILAKNVEQGNNDAIALVSNLGQMSSNQETLSLEQLVPNPTGAVALMEANDVSGREVTDRVLDNIPLSINIASADELNGEYGIAAGDKPTKYGVWISPFYQKAEQKSYKKNPGYKVTNYGGTIGADTMLSDTTTIGLAWTYLKSELKNQGKAGADKGTTDTNVASFYSFTDLNNNYFISGIAAIGFSKIENNEQRLITRTKTQIAQSKYNSRVYTAKVLGGKQQKVADLFTMIPLIGLRYTQFNDDAYKETGASIQNLSVDKKSSSITELIIGNKFNKLYVTENLWQIRPELSAFAYVNLKEKVATTKISNAAFVNPIELKGVKTSKTWYSLGTAVGITKGLMEYNASYELQLDKKYMGHQAMLKLRVNF